MVDYITRTARDVWRIHGVQLGNVGHSPEDAYNIVEEWVAQARKRGLRTESQMRTYIDACAILGAAKVESPSDPILATILNDPLLRGGRKSELLAHCLAFGVSTHYKR